MEPSLNRREREKLRKLLKKSRSVFKKNLFQNIRLIEKQFRSIEPDRGSPKILKDISIYRKIVWINRKSRKTYFVVEFLKGE